MKISRIIAMLLCISLVLTMSACGSKRELKREEKKLKEYLKAKYNDEFVINKLDYYIPQIGSLMIKGTASPKDNKDIKFDISSSPLEKYADDKFGEDYKGNGHYDNYLSYLWRDRAEEIYGGYCKKIWGDSIINVKIRPSGGIELSGDNYLNESPKFDDALKMYPESIKIEIRIEFENYKFVLDDEAVRILKLINYINKPKLKYYRLTFIYDEKHYITVWENDIDTIKTAVDVKKDYYIVENKE